MNNLTTIYLLRHAQSEGNAHLAAGDYHKVSISKLGSDLTKLGLSQARDVAEKLKDIHFDKIFSSDLLRAKRTAEIIAAERMIAVDATELIRELHFGNLPGESLTQEIREEIKRNMETLSDAEKMKYKYTPDMESRAEGASRLITFIREVALAYPGTTVLIVTHGNLMRSFLIHLGFATMDELPQGSIKNTGYITIESDGIELNITKTHGIEKQANIR